MLIGPISIQGPYKGVGGFVAKTSFAEKFEIIFSPDIKAFYQMFWCLMPILLLNTPVLTQLYLILTILVQGQRNSSV